MGGFRVARAFDPCGLALLALLWLGRASAAPAGAPVLNESVKLQPKESPTLNESVKLQPKESPARNESVKLQPKEFLQSQPPTELEFARDVVRAMRDEYLHGEDGAVGALLDGEAISEKVGKSVEAEEQHIRSCRDPQAELRGFEDHEEKVLGMTGLAPEAEDHAVDLMEVEPAEEGVPSLNASTQELFFGSRRRAVGGGGGFFGGARRRSPVFYDSRRRAPVFYDSRRRSPIYYDSRRRTPYYYGSRRRTTYIWWGGGGGGGYGYGPGYYGGGGGLIPCLWPCICLLCCGGLGWFFCCNGSGGMVVVEREPSFQEPLLRPQYIQPVQSVPGGPRPDPDVARGFVAALRAEYLEGRDGAVGGFMNSAQVSEAVGRSMEAEEENLRTSYDRGAALRDLEIRWGLAGGYVQPAPIQNYAAPAAPPGGLLQAPPPDVARGFVAALRAEYLEGRGGAVGDFMDMAQQPEEVVRGMDAEEENIRTSYDKDAALRNLEIRWNVSQPMVQPMVPPMMQPTAPEFVVGGPVPPFNPEFARRFVDALRAEYLEGMDGAVGAFQNDAAFDESLRETMESEEENIRLSPDRYAALRDLEYRWGI